MKFNAKLFPKILLYSNPWDLEKWKTIFGGSVLKSKGFWLRKCEFDYKLRFTKVSKGKWKPAEKYNERYQIYKKIFKTSIITDPKEFYFLHLEEKQRMPFIPIEDISNVKLLKVKIEMINSDFDARFNINQVELARILRKSPYNLFVIYDSLNYPGVNIKYKCSVPGKKDKDITILVFRTGQVIITGGKCKEHIQMSYEFINKVFKDHYKKLWVPRQIK
jgi:hypothetical protein